MCDGCRLPCNRLRLFVGVFLPAVTEVSNLFFSAIHRNFLILPASCAKRTQLVCSMAEVFWGLTGSSVLSKAYCCAT